MVNLGLTPHRRSPKKGTQFDFIHRILIAPSSFVANIGFCCRHLSRYPKNKNIRMHNMVLLNLHVCFLTCDFEWLCFNMSKHQIFRHFLGPFFFQTSLPGYVVLRSFLFRLVFCSSETARHGRHQHCTEDL